MNEIKEAIQKELKNLQNAKQTIRSADRAMFKSRKKLEKNGLDSVHLVVESKNDNYSYYSVSPYGKRTYLKKKEDSGIIQCLAQKEYDSMLINWIDECTKTLEKMEKICPQKEIMDIYDSLHPARKSIISPIIESDEEYAKSWLEKNYLSNDFALPIQTKDMVTKNGEIVRSKSEAIIADMLFDNDVPYRYEPELTLNSGRCVFPDFICLNKRKRKEYVWEHFGMMDDLDYICHNIPKLREYEQSGYLLGNNLIISYESSVVGLSTKVIQDYIELYLK